MDLKLILFFLKNDLVYRYPNNENIFWKQNINLIQLIETIRGLFMTFALAIKDIDKTDQAVW